MFCIHKVVGSIPVVSKFLDNIKVMYGSAKSVMPVRFWLYPLYEFYIFIFLSSIGRALVFEAKCYRFNSCRMVIIILFNFIKGVE